MTDEWNGADSGDLLAVVSCAFSNCADTEFKSEVIFSLVLALLLLVQVALDVESLAFDVTARL